MRRRSRAFASASARHARHAIRFRRRRWQRRPRGTLYDYADGLGGGFVVRRYDDSPGAASFLARHHIASDRKRAALATIPYEESFFRSVARHLLAHEGKTELSALTTRGNGCEPVELSRIQGA